MTKGLDHQESICRPVQTTGVMSRCNGTFYRDTLADRSVWGRGRLGFRRAYFALTGSDGTRLPGRLARTFWVPPSDCTYWYSAPGAYPYFDATRLSRLVLATKVPRPRSLRQRRHS